MERKRVLKRRKREKPNNIIAFPFMRAKAMMFNKKLRASGREIPVPIFPADGDVGDYPVIDILRWTQGLLWDLDFIELGFKEAFNLAFETLLDADPKQKILQAKIPKNKRSMWAC